MRFIIYIASVVGGYLLWTNRFSIQRQLESAGIKTPTLKGGMGESVHSMASKAVGKVEHGMNVGEDRTRRTGT